MAAVIAEFGKKVLVPSKMKFPLGLKVYVEDELSEEVIVEPEENLDGYRPTVVLHLKPKNDCKKFEKRRKATEKRLPDFAPL